MYNVSGKTLVLNEVDNKKTPNYKKPIYFVL